MNIFEKIKPFLIEKGIDALLITEKSARRYATRFSSSDGAVLIFGDFGYNIVDFRYIEAAREKANGFEVVLQEKGIANEISHLCAEHNVKNLGFEEGSVTVKEYSVLGKELANVSLVPAGELLNTLRQSKDEEEIACIKKAQNITDKAFSHILNYIKIGVSESDIVAELDYFMKKNGAEDFSFSTKVLSGKNTSLPHGEPSDKKVKANDFVMMDYGAVYNGLCSDMTRTVAVGGATDEMKSIYTIVLKAQEAALQIIAAGKTGAEIDKAARDLIEEHGFGKKFGHGLGHGVGYLVHEEPRFSPLYKGVIPLNSVLTVEPGIYLPSKFGVRIEDLVVVTPLGHENLTKSPKEFIIL